MDARHVSAAEIRRQLGEVYGEVTSCQSMAKWHSDLNPVGLGQWIMKEVAGRQQLLQRSRCAILELPPYSPDLTPIAFQVFPAHKDHLFGQRFEKAA